MSHTIGMTCCLVLLLGALQLASAQACTKKQTRCNLYNDTCCDGLMCSMDRKCTTTALGTQKCVTKCAKEDQHVTRQVTIGDYKAWESGKRKAPAVLVIQEWWGVNEAIKSTARHLAMQGYRTLIPDIYQGDVALSAAEARNFSSSLNWTTAIRQFVEAVDYLKATGSPKVGVTGFCQGGGLSFCAAQYADVDIAVPFYGAPNREYCQPEKIKVPMQLHVGLADSASLIANMNSSYMDIVASGMVPATFYKYPDTRHAFMNGLTEEGRALLNGNLTQIPLESVTTAFARLTAILARYLRC